MTFVKVHLLVILGQRIPSALLGSRICGNSCPALHQSAFMSLHRLLLLLIATMWPGIGVRVGLLLGLRAIKLLVCQLAIMTKKVLYAEAVGFIARQTRPPSSCLVLLLGLGLSSFLRACTILGVGKGHVLTISFWIIPV